MGGGGYSLFAVRVQLSRAYGKVDKTSVRISLALEAKEFFLFLHIGFSLEKQLLCVGNPEKYLRFGYSIYI